VEGGIGGGTLEYGPPELTEDSLEGGPGGRGELLHYLPFGIQGIGFDPKPQGSSIALVEARKYRGKMGIRPDEDHENSRRERVKRAGMPKLGAVEASF
jgi:hypothetical protein